MKRKKTINILLLILFILLITGAFLILDRKNLIEKNQKISSINHMLNSNIFSLNETLKIAYLSDDLLLENVEIVSVNKQVLHLHSVLDRKPTLLFIIPEVNCESCIDRGIEKLKDFLSQIDNKKAIVLASYKNFRDFYAFSRVANLNCEIYNFKQGSLNLPADKLIKPYFFVVKPNLRIEKLFVPIKSFNHPIDNYFEIIKANFKSERLKCYKKGKPEWLTFKTSFNKTINKINVCCPQYPKF